MKRVLISGATGLVGSHLMSELLGSPAESGSDNRPTYRPVALARSAGSWQKLDWLLARRGLEGAAFDRQTAELEYFDDCRRLMREWQPDVVFHCAARVWAGAARDGEELVRDNVAMTHNLVTAALELPDEARPTFVHVSSIAALGTGLGPNGCVDEGSVMENLAGASAYARSKFLAENEVWRAAAHGLRVAVVNPAVVLGAMSPDSGYWLNGLFAAMRRGANRFWIEGEAPFVSADDVARALLRLAEQPEAWGKRYILSAENLSYRRFLGRIARAVGRAEPTLRFPRWLVRMALPFAPSLAAVTAPHPRYDGSAILRAVPSFRYTDLADTLNELGQA